MNKSKLFKLAWQLLDNFQSFGEALKHAWKVMKLKAKMKKDYVYFKYKKVSGEIREAVGTLNFSYQSKGTGKSAPSDNMLYFDKDAGGLRSCKIVNIL